MWLDPRHQLVNTRFKWQHQIRHTNCKLLWTNLERFDRIAGDSGGGGAVSRLNFVHLCCLYNSTRFCRTADSRCKAPACPEPHSLCMNSTHLLFGRRPDSLVALSQGIMNEQIYASFVPAQEATLSSVQLVQVSNGFKCCSFAQYLFLNTCRRALSLLLSRPLSMGHAAPSE